MKRKVIVLVVVFFTFDRLMHYKMGHQKEVKQALSAFDGHGRKLTQRELIAQHKLATRFAANDAVEQKTRLC